MKRKFLSILLTLAMALTLLPDSGNGEQRAQTNDVAQIGGTGYATLQAAIDGEKRRYDCFEEIHFDN